MGRDAPRGLRYLKARYPKVEAVNLVLADGLERVSNEDVRTRSLVAFLAALV